MDLKFAAFPDEVPIDSFAAVDFSQPKVEKERKKWVPHHEDRPLRTPPELSKMFNIADAAKVRNGVKLHLKSTTDIELDANIELMRQKAAAIVTNSEAVPIPYNASAAPCPKQLECSDIWTGTCTGKHSKAHGLLVYLLGHIYTVDGAQRPQQQQPAGIFDIEEQSVSNVLNFLYVPSAKQTCGIHAKTRSNIPQAKLRHLYAIDIPEFFAGKPECLMMRIGALKLTDCTFIKNKHGPSDVWCHMPYCHRSLLAPTLATARRPACGLYHSHINSILTNIIRSLLECERVALDESPAPATRNKDKYNRKKPPRPATAAAAAPQPSVKNTYADLPQDDDIKAAAAAPETDAAQRIRDLEKRLAEFDAKHPNDEVKTNSALRERRERLLGQIDKYRASN